MDQLLRLALDHRQVRAAAGGQDYRVRFFPRDRVRGHFAAAVDAGAVALGFAGEIGDDTAEFGAPRQKLGEPRLTARLPVALMEIDTYGRVRQLPPRLSNRQGHRQ